VLASTGSIRGRWWAVVGGDTDVNDYKGRVCYHVIHRHFWITNKTVEIRN
jgi:hypothetical protein